MRCWRHGGWIGTALTLAVASVSVTAQSLPERIQNRLSASLEGDRPITGVAAPNHRRWTLTRQFYARRAGRPAWVDAFGGQRSARELLGTLVHADRVGLDPGDYPAVRIASLLSQAPDPDSLALLELLLTDAFLHYGQDVSVGRVVPELVDTMWAGTSRRIDLVARLATALDSNLVGGTLEALAPSQPEAVRLREALARYRDIAGRGGWPRISSGPALAIGAAGPRVQLLRQRLVAGGDLAPGGGGGGESLDSAVVAAVARAQARHGLEPDGIVGRATVAALDVPVSDRIRQMELNLERWRWVARESWPRHIDVNSAAFTLEFVDSGCVVLATPIVAGRSDWPTPITSGTLTEVVFNPRWNIPRTIAVREILPVVRRDSTYLARTGIHVLSDYTADAVELDPSAIPWGSVAPGTFGYRLWQDPGPKNPLGQIRFGVSNRFGIALHDTPAQELFRVRTRAFSHGCVRIAGAAELALHVLRGAPEWTEDSVLAAIDQLQERHVTVPQPIPVIVGYWTAWVEEDGTVQFRSDVYRWDAKLAAALRRASHREAPAARQ